MKASDLLIFALPVLLLLFLFQSQRRRQKSVVDLQDKLAPGQEVVTTSGLFGRIVSLDERVAVLEVGPGQTVRWDRRAIATVVPDAQTSGPILADTTSDGDVAPEPPADPASDAQNDEK